MDETGDAAAAVERTVSLAGVDLYVVEMGAGTPIVLLHGFPQSSREWAGVASLLAPHARVVVPDLRGSGRSGAPGGSYRLEVLGDDVLGLLDALGIERAVVVGHDIGALVAADLAMRHPERVSRLVVMSVPPMYLRMTGSMVGSMKYLWFQYALAVPGLGARLLRGGRQRLPRWLFATFAHRGGVSAADIDAYLADLRDRAQARAGSKKYRQLVVPVFLRIVLGRYRDRLPIMPTLVLFGADDPVVPRDALAGVEDHMPDVAIETIADAGHWLADEQPAAVARRIVEFAAA
ncbi:alpha/beta fold hydrolase [Microbacterium sp. NPDC055910]|uniref:alpha/beta fold hydrolase n=1 Tax=Microbacterium sp. NPDC055910 TaxID=3345659 RepID=UPI0035E1601E